ncbi:hypothetical protein BH23GEM2_BH23GEM2_10080 [soil metagenome]
MRTITRPLFAASAALLLAVPVLEAQARQTLGIDGGRGHLGIVTVNPIAVLAGALNGDIELNFAPGFTGAVSGTNWPDEYSSLDFTFRYYPGEINPAGFSVGASVGRVNWDPDNEDGEQTKGPTVGFHVGYNWLLGRSERLAIATGLGAKRVFASRDRYPNRQELLPSGRFGVGLAF